jgi:hypothetical protein
MVARLAGEKYPVKYGLTAFFEVSGNQKRVNAQSRPDCKGFAPWRFLA